MQRKIEWAGMYADWESSGVSKVGYVRSNRTAQFTSDGQPVTLATFYAGLYRFVRRREAEATSKVPVQVHVINEAAVLRTVKPAVAAGKAQHVVIEMPGGATMHFECADAERFAISAMFQLRVSA